MNDSEGRIGLKSPKVMGDFPGHAIVGVFLLVTGLWWGTKSILKYICKKQKRISFLDSKAIFHRVEIFEGISLITMTLIGTAGLLVAGALSTDKQTQLVRILRWHHLTMYFFFGLLGVTTILCVTISSLPVSLNKLMLSNAFFVEGYVFLNHTHGREIVDAFVHHMVVYVAFVTGLLAFLEVLIQNNILLELLRSSFMLLQGSWFLQFSFVLFSPGGGPPWDLMDQENVMFLTMCFCWHYALAWVIIGVDYAFVAWLVKSRLKRFCSSEAGLLKSAEREQESEEEM